CGPRCFRVSGISERMSCVGCGVSGGDTEYWSLITGYLHFPLQIRSGHGMVAAPQQLIRIQSVPSMPPLFQRFSISIIAVGFLFTTAARAAAPRIEDRLEKGLLDVVQKYCFDCHDNDMRKGDVSLELLREDSPVRYDIRLWDKVRDQLRSRSMPPK